MNTSDKELDRKKIIPREFNLFPWRYEKHRNKFQY